MPSMTTTLTELGDSGINSRTYTLTGHSVNDTRIVISKWKNPGSIDGSAEYNFQVVYSTEDSNGDPTKGNVNFSVTCRSPKNGVSADRDAALVILRDIVASDEFANSVATLHHLA